MTLYWSGVILEAVGLLLVAASDYVPLTKQVGREVKQRGGSLSRDLKHLLRGRPHTPQTHKIGVAGEISTAGSISNRKGKTISGPVEGQIAWLLTEVADLRRSIDEFGARIDKQPWRAEIDRARAEFRERIERRLTEAQERYLLARRSGLVCLLVGIALVTASNL